MTTGTNADEERAARDELRGQPTLKDTVVNRRYEQQSCHEDWSYQFGASPITSPTRHLEGLRNGGSPQVGRSRRHNREDPAEHADTG